MRHAARCRSSVAAHAPPAAAARPPVRRPADPGDRPAGRLRAAHRLRPRARTRRSTSSSRCWASSAASSPAMTTRRRPGLRPRDPAAALLFGTVDPASAIRIFGRSRPRPKLPDPHGVLVAITTVLGALFGAWGGALRARSSQARRDAGRGLGGPSCAAIWPRRKATSSSSSMRGREARRLAVAAAAGLAGDRRDVDLAVGRAQRDLLAPAVARRQLADQRGDLRALRPSAGGR